MGPGTDETTGRGFPLVDGRATGGGPVSELQTTSSQLSTSLRHRVVVVGGGFGGLNVVRALAHAEVDVTVVDRTNHHLFQPLLYQARAAILPPGVVAPAPGAAIRNNPTARPRRAAATTSTSDGG